MFNKKIKDELEVLREHVDKHEECKKCGVVFNKKFLKIVTRIKKSYLPFCMSTFTKKEYFCKKHAPKYDYYTIEHPSSAKTYYIEKKEVNKNGKII